MAQLAPLRLSTRTPDDRIELHYLTERDHPWLRALLDEYERGVGAKRAALVARLREPLPVVAPKWKQRLAVDVLQDLAEARVDAAVPPREARWQLFSAAASSTAPREQIFQAVGIELGVTVEQLEAALLADLKSERTASALPQGVTPQRIAADANLLLASRWIARAQSVRVRAWGNTRALVRQARLHGLICNVRRCAAAVPLRPGPSLDPLVEPQLDAIELEISGPLSLFRHTLLYGRALCALLPRLAWCARFELTARCEYGPGVAPVALTIRSGELPRPARELKAFDSQLEQRFARDFRKVAPDWDVIREPRPVESAGSLIFPDFELVHRHDTSRRFLLEIVGYWTPKYLEDKLKKLREAKLDTVILCIDEARACSEADLPRHAKVVRYRRRIDARQVLEVLMAGA